MVVHSVTSKHSAEYGTHSHGEETFATPGGTVPAQLKWADLHPPGVKVLPKGAAPAGAGEINWEDTLGGKFALALEKLEGLLYAVFGSRPAAYPDGGSGYDKCQWYDRLHPRCLWAPETWERRLLMGPSGCTEAGECNDYQPVGKEYAALGENPPCCPMPRPTVPIRSRSGDPAKQYQQGEHDRSYFPLGSVARTADDAYPYDPTGKGWFGATQPGRTDVQPWLTAANGYTWEDGEPVVVSWVKPGGNTQVSNVRLYRQTKPPGSSWGGWGWSPMTWDGEKYTGTIGAQPHGTECRWYIRYYWDDPDPQIDPVTRYEPGGSSVPDAADAYYFQWYTHFNPYGHGLPEMLDDYGGVDVRRGTDFYQFDGSESVQPGLINIARWILSWLGGDCCTGEYETCAETDARCGAVHHNPRTRGTDDGLCCIPMPIRFRWSGSNKHPHYLTGGKGLVGGPTPDSRPLHNHPDHVPTEPNQWGSEAARKTWRGINMLYHNYFSNPFYGGGYSWGTAPGTFVLMYEPLYDVTAAKVYSKYPSWGLRPGDVIEAVHVQEIVDAVQYLIDYGVWTSEPLCTRRRTPASCFGHECGWSGFESYGSEFQGDPTHHNLNEQKYGCKKCCANDACCYSQPHCLGWWWHVIQDEFEDSATEFPFICQSYATPTWADCTSDCRYEKCYIQMSRVGSANSSLDGFSWGRGIDWNYGAYPTPGSHDGCGAESAERICWQWDPNLETYVPAPRRYSCGVAAQGQSYWACGPTACPDGWDDNHGNGFIKARVDHSWPLSPVATGPPGNEGAGNCYGDMFMCGEIEALGLDAGLWFGEVAGVEWKGLVSSWATSRCTGMPATGSDCPWSAGDVQALPSPVPGLGYHDAGGSPLCSVWYRRWVAPEYDAADGHSCNCSLGDLPVCKGREVWVAVDLNLDGSGRPYHTFNGRNGDLTPYMGRGVPRLRDYDLTKDPATWMHDCPCETWTGASPCL